MLESFKNMTNCGVKKRIYAYKKMPSARVELTISSLLVRCLTNLAIKASMELEVTYSVMSYMISYHH